MRKICERTAFLSHITLFRDYERAGELTVPVKVVICPKLILTQRFCPEEFPREVRIILSLFNYEDRAFEKLCLAHELAGVPFSYLDVFSQDPFAIEEGVLNVNKLPAPFFGQLLFAFCSGSGELRANCF